MNLFYFITVGVLYPDYVTKFSTFRQVFSTVYQMRMALVEKSTLSGEFCHPLKVVEIIVENLAVFAV